MLRRRLVRLEAHLGLTSDRCPDCPPIQVREGRKGEGLPDLRCPRCGRRIECIEVVRPVGEERGRALGLPE